MTTSGATRTSFFGWRWFSRVADAVREGGAGVATLLYPAECACCCAPTRWGAVVCDSCAGRLPRAGGSCCRQCGEPLASPSLDLCLRCGTRVRSFDHAISLGPYDNGWRELLHAYKFAREKAIGRWLGRELSARFVTEGETIDVVTHVPMTRREERARGFNPSRLLAGVTARRLGLPERRLLTKTRETPPQRSLTARDRGTNLRDAFRAVRSGRGAVLLVDDLLTTGATADECARKLKETGFERVIVLTVARA